MSFFIWIWFWLFGPRLHSSPDSPGVYPQAAPQRHHMQQIILESSKNEIAKSKIV